MELNNDTLEDSNRESMMESIPIETPQTCTTDEVPTPVGSTSSNPPISTTNQESVASTSSSTTNSSSNTTSNTTTSNTPTNSDANVNTHVNLVAKDTSNSGSIPKNVLTALKKDRSVNPLDWDTKIDFWSDVMKSRSSRTLIQTKEMLKQHCDIGDRKYYVDWERVLSELEKRVVFLSLDEFEKNYDDTKKESFSTWLWNRVGWLGEAQPSSPNDLSKKYINVDLVKSICIQWINDVYSNVTGPVDLIFPPSQISQYLKGKFDPIVTTDEEVHHLINFMHHEGPASIYYTKDKKKGLVFSNDSTYRGTVNITPSHLNIACVKEAQCMIEQHIEDLTKYIEASTENIRKLIQQQNRSKAKWEFGRKRSFEKALERRRASLLNLESILSAIQTAHSDKQVLEALQSGAATLKTLTADLSHAEDTLESVTEALLDYKDIQEVVDSYYAESSQIDDHEILDNLKKLSMEISEEESKQNEPSKDSTIELGYLPDIKYISCSSNAIKEILSRFEGHNIEQLQEKDKKYYQTLVAKQKFLQIQQKKRKSMSAVSEKQKEAIEFFEREILESTDSEVVETLNKCISLIKKEMEESSMDTPVFSKDPETKKQANFSTPYKEKIHS